MSCTSLVSNAPIDSTALRLTSMSSSARLMVDFNTDIICWESLSIIFPRCANKANLLSATAAFARTSVEMSVLNISDNS